MPKFRKKPEVVEAMKLKAPVTIQASSGGDETGEPGDFLVTSEAGGQTIVKASVFAEHYTQISRDRKKK